MAAKSFANFVSADFNDPNNFNPTGLPQSGDTVSIVLASPHVSGLLTDGLRIGVYAQPYNGYYSLLTLQDATVPTHTNIIETTAAGTSTFTYRAALQFAGTIVNDGTITFRGIVQPVQLPGGTTLTNAGTINVDGSPQFITTATNVAFTNDGLIRIANAANTVQKALVGLPIGGTGTITVSANTTLELASATASTQTLRFVGGTGAGALVQIDQPALFAATLAGFVIGDTLCLANTTATSLAYTPAGNGTGTLQLFNGSTTPITTLTLSGTYTTGAFTLTQSGTAVQITTAITDPATGSTTANPAEGVFRFFDTADGTHFLTASVFERDSVLVDHPEFIQESNGFGAVRVADATTTPVYRAFDTVHGTHFFTTSAAERDQTIATRPDLTNEPPATFLEHSAQQPGDVAVYRFFSTTDGTHLYTGSASERAALTTPSSTGYRPDLIPEGISFYAPSGTYT